jgi:hypothetical protein
MAMVRSCDGTSIAFRRYGTGPAIVLVGGAPGVAGRLAVLLAGFTVFHHDRRGTGDSGDTAPYALAREVEDLEAVIASAGGPVSLAGLGSGAVLALEAARTLPGITRLALCGPTSRARPHTPLPHPAAPGLLGTGVTPAPGPLGTGVMAARWSCVSIPTLVLDEPPTCDEPPAGSAADGSAFDGGHLARLLPDGRHRSVSSLAPAALAPHLTEFFTTSTPPPCRRASRWLPAR